MTIWLNGALSTEVLPDFDDLGFSFHEGLYEVIRSSGGRPLHLRRHWRRLRAGAAVLELAMPYADSVLSMAVRSLLAEEGGGDRMVRVTLTRGATPKGFLPPREGTPSVLITASALPAPPVPAALIISAVTRRNEYSPLTRIKTLSTLDSLLARQEAIRLGADDAVLVNSTGRVAQASAANLFFLFGEEIVTPPTDEGVLPGISREIILERMPVTQRPLTVQEAVTADGIVMTTSLALRAAASLNGRPLPRSEALLKRLSQAL